MNNTDIVSFLVDDYINHPPTIRHIVVEVPKDDLLEDDVVPCKLAKLNEDLAIAEVRQALNRWYYDC